MTEGTVDLSCSSSSEWWEDETEDSTNSRECNQCQELLLKLNTLEKYVSHLVNFQGQLLSLSMLKF